MTEKKYMRQRVNTRNKLKIRNRIHRKAEKKRNNRLNKRMVNE